MGVNRFQGAKVVRSCWFVTLMYALPLAGAPELLLRPDLIAIAAVFLIVDLFQPNISAEANRCPTDRYSFAIIMATAPLCQILPILEWAYFRPPNAGLVEVSVGMGLLLVGAALRIWSIQTLGRFFSARVELQEQHRLVRGGPYRWIRHPSYTGALLFLVGVPVLLATPVSLVCCALLLTAAYAYRIPVEERMLSRHFGEAFSSYQNETKRLVPYLW